MGISQLAHLKLARASYATPQLLFTLQRSGSQTYAAASAALPPNSYHGAGQILPSHCLDSATGKMGNKIFSCLCCKDYCLGWLGAEVSALLEKKSSAKKAQAKKHSQGVCTNAACVRKAVPSISNLREEPLPSPPAAARHHRRLARWLLSAQPRRLTPGPQSQAAALP